MEGEVIVPQKKHGGARPGAGPPKGHGFRNANIARKLLQDGEASPLEVLVSTMRFWWRRAENLTAQLEEAEKFLASMTPAAMAEMIGADSANASERLKEMQQNIERLSSLWARVETFRGKAQACAADAAPYCHPRLAALAVAVNGGAGDSKKPLIDISPEMTAQQAVDAYGAYLREQHESPAVPTAENAD